MVVINTYCKWSSGHWVVDQLRRAAVVWCLPWPRTLWQDHWLQFGYLHFLQDKDGTNNANMKKWQFSYNVKKWKRFGPYVGSHFSSAITSDCRILQHWNLWYPKRDLYPDLYKSVSSLCNKDLLTPNCPHYSCSCMIDHNFTQHIKYHTNYSYFATSSMA